jgi:hypothetical protein
MSGKSEIAIGKKSKVIIQNYKSQSANSNSVLDRFLGFEDFIV